MDESGQCHCGGKYVYLFHDKTKGVMECCFNCWRALAVKKIKYIHLVTGGWSDFTEARKAYWEGYHERKAEERRARYEEKINNDTLFFSSREWLELRYRVLRRFGRRCACCGASGSEARIHIDHIKPRSIYPELALCEENLQVLCEDCNIGKSNRYEDDFRPSA